MHGARLLAQVAGDLFLGAEAAEHAERQDGDDEQQQEARDQSHTALAASQQATDSEACSSVHVCTPARAMTWMTRSKAMVAGCSVARAGLYSGLVKVRITRTELTLFQSLPFGPAVFI